MDKMTFASYKFKPSDVINGLNRYFAETKAHRYLRVPLEIKNGEVKPGNYYVFRNIVFDVNVPKVKDYGYYYLICDPEEVVGAAINWLREEHDIFYTPGMEVPDEDCGTFCDENLDAVPVARVRKILGINREVDFFEALRCARGDMDAATRLRLESSELRHQNHELVRRLADIRKAAGMSDLNPMDLVEYIRDLVKSRRESLDRWYDEHVKVLDMKDEILKVYREIFDCSNGDPEGTDVEALQDILTEYKRCLKLKDVAEEKTIKYKELARENEEKANKHKVRLDNAERQIRWMEEVNNEWLEKYEKLTKEMEKVKSLEQKLIEIQDICER